MPRLTNDAKILSVAAAAFATFSYFAPGWFGRFLGTSPQYGNPPHTKTSFFQYIKPY